MSAAAGFAVFATHIGCCGIAWGGSGIVGVQLPLGDEQSTRACMRRRFPQAADSVPPAAVATAMARIRRMLEGEPDPLLDIPLDMSEVPPFQQQVYEITRAIAPGRTLTYGEIAVRLGQPGAARAVGQALGHNPFAPVVPCHRVLGARNASGGFSAEGGVATKLRMLQIENARMGPEPGLFD